MDNNSKDKKEYAGNNKDNSDGITDIQIDTSFEQVAYNPEAIKAVRESLDSISRAYQPVVDSMKQTTTLMANILSQAVKVDYDRFFGNIRKSLQVLTDAISRINIPHISEERKKELVESHKEWGHHGWTPIPVVEAETLLDSFPLSKKDADDKALKFCRGDRIKQIFEAISNCKKVKKIDFEEALFDYKNHKYKSCALVLFSLIDAIFIRIQNRNEYRKVGIGAISKAKKIAEEETPEFAIFSLLENACVYSCLETMFVGRDNFQSNPEVINRNYLDHGMLTRKVRQKDCIQLFVLYYNVLKMIE